MIHRRRLLGISAASLLAPHLCGRTARAQGWPNRFVRIIVPYVAGGPTDFVTRVVADRLAKIWSQQGGIENRGGAGTNLGAGGTARSDPDGYTMMLGSAAVAVNRNPYRTLSYDLVAGFRPGS